MNTILTLWMRKKPGWSGKFNNLKKKPHRQMPTSERKLSVDIFLKHYGLLFIFVSHSMDALKVLLSLQNSYVVMRLVF